LKEYYPNLNFKILTIQFIKKENTDHIINYYYDFWKKKIYEVNKISVTDKTKYWSINTNPPNNKTFFLGENDIILLNFFKNLFKNRPKIPNKLKIGS